MKFLQKNKVMLDKINFMDYLISNKPIIIF